jgi:deoxyribodipyrimidine photo-lyase
MDRQGKKTMQQMTLGDQQQDEAWALEPDQTGPWVPSREAGLDRLERFVPRAGRDYQTHRNTDRGATRHVSVSQLSPYLRHRLLTEQQVLERVLEDHSASAAFKFVQEVFWRTYWKGWLEHRSGLWPEYQRRLPQVLEQLRADPRRWEDYEKAIAGQTPMPLFNEWCQELVQTGYLHNHARMWFASIWIFSLGLPWQLGADFFVRHLLDGDPASNTLGWRWVAGLHTAGKTYLATPNNIRSCAPDRLQGRSDLELGLNRLAATAVAVREDLPAKALQRTDIVWPKPATEEQPGYRCNRGRTALLMTEEDLEWFPDQPVDAVAALSPSPRSVLGPSSELVQQFVQGATADALDRRRRYADSKPELPEQPVVAEKPLDDEALMRFLLDQRIDQVVYAYTPMGPTRLRVENLQQQLASKGVEMKPVLRDYDRMVWPHASKGFFQLGKRIPEFLAAMNL